jgi:hypothetical protein
MGRLGAASIFQDGAISGGLRCATEVSVMPYSWFIVLMEQSDEHDGNRR